MPGRVGILIEAVIGEEDAMRRSLLLAVAAVFLAACAPQPPEGLKAVIEKEHPNARYLEVKQGSVADAIYDTYWCVAYEPDPSDSVPLILVEIYNDTTWIPLDRVWARELHTNDPKPDGGWCYRVQK
jgi:hypothetical protein